MEDRTCVVCGLSFTPSRTGSVCCSRACWASRGVPECSVDGCNKPNRARGLCAAHWKREHGKQAKPQETACSVCGVIVVRYVYQSRRPTCSGRCKYVLDHGRDIAHGRELVGPVARRWPPEYRVPPQTPAKAVIFASGVCPWCGEWFTHDTRVTGTLSRFCSPRCSKRHHKAESRRRRGQFAVTRQRRLALYERDGWTCQLCGEPVDRLLPATDMWAASLDHIECQSWALVPDHSDANLRLVHRMCNSVRGDRDDAIERNFVPSHSGMAQSLRIGTQ